VCWLAGWLAGTHGTRPWCCAASGQRGQRGQRPAASALVLRPGSAEAGVAGPSG